MANVDEILEERSKTHGSYPLHAFTAQRIKDSIRETSGWSQLDPVHREALEMIAHKIARILNGDHTYVDHWDDIAGYSKLVSKYHGG